MSELKKIASLIERLASAVDELVKREEANELAKTKGVSEFVDCVRNRYKPHIGVIVAAVRRHGADNEAIVRELKEARVIARDTKWKDVTFFEAVQKRIRGPRRL